MVEGANSMCAVDGVDELLAGKRVLIKGEVQESALVSSTDHLASSPYKFIGLKLTCKIVPKTIVHRNKGFAI